MNRQDTFEQLTQMLQQSLFVTNLYDLEPNKSHIRMILIPIDSEHPLLKDLPHIVFDHVKLAGVFSIELFQQNDFCFSHYITETHLELWHITKEELLCLSTGIHLNTT